MTKQIRQIFTMVFFTLLGIGLMVWIYRGFDFHPLVRVFSIRDNYLWIVLTLLVGVAANVLRAIRWRMLLIGAQVPIGRRRAIELVFISYLINSVTPRLGELTRALLVRKGSVSSSAKAFGTVVIEKLADVFCLLFVVAFSIILRWEDTVVLIDRSLARLNAAFSSTVFYGVLMGLLVFTLIFVWLKVGRLRVLMHSLWEGISAISKLQCPWLFWGLCVAIWTCNFLQMYLLVPCFESLSSLNIIDVFFLFAAASVGVLLPTPGGAGPWHFAIVKTLTGIFTMDGQVAKLFALVTHGLKTALVMLLGLLAYVTFYWEVLSSAKSRHSKHHMSNGRS